VIVHDEATGVSIMRVPISLPCQARVVPGTPNTDAPIEERTEFCAVDAWWMIGKAFLCTHHFREAWPEMLAEFVDDPEFHGLNETEQRPWAEMNRYSQQDAKGESPLPAVL
jgi:hypothetical protein